MVVAVNAVVLSCKHWRLLLLPLESGKNDASCSIIIPELLPPPLTCGDSNNFNILVVKSGILQIPISHWQLESGW